MSKLVEIRKALGRILFNFEEVTVNDIVYIYEELVVGGEVFKYDESGEKVSAGDVTFEVDGKTVVVENGVITEIKEEESVEEVIETEEEVEITEEEVVEEVNEIEVRVSALEVKVDEILKILNSTVEIVEEFSSQEVGEKIEKKVVLNKESKEEVKGAMRYFTK